MPSAFYARYWSPAAYRLPVRVNQAVGLYMQMPGKIDEMNRLKLIYPFIAAIIATFLSACGGGDNKTAVGNSANPVTYSFGRTQSSDTSPGSPVVNENLAAWLIRYIPENEEVYLSTRTAPFSEGGSDKWAMTVRVDPQLIPGTIAGPNLNVRLFSNYRNACCLNTADPYGSAETYEHAYAAVGGTMTFNSEKQAVFDLQMQEEVPARSGNFIGTAFRLKGCWHLPGEQATSPDCTIPQ